MENNETKNVELQPTEIVEVKRKPNLVVRAGKWLWAKKWYLLTGLASFAAGVVLSSTRDEVEVYVEDDEPNEESTDE